MNFLLFYRVIFYIKKVNLPSLVSFTAFRLDSFGEEKENLITSQMTSKHMIKKRTDHSFGLWEIKQFFSPSENKFINNK